MGKRSTTVQGGAASTIVGRHAPLRGFSVGPPVQPTVRLGVGVVGLLPLQNAGEPAARQIVDQLSPAPRWGFFYGRALCKHAAGLLAAFPERCNSLCEGHPSWQAHLPPP